MSLEHLLRDVPTIEEWAAAHTNVADLSMAGIGQVEEAYSEEFSVRLSAFDDDGWPTMPRTTTSLMPSLAHGFPMRRKRPCCSRVRDRCGHS